VSDFVPGYEALFWVALGTRKKSAPSLIDKLNNEINAGLADPRLKARFANLGATVFPARLTTLASSSLTKPRKRPR
jgi:hypothetical protein